MSFLSNLIPSSSSSSKLSASGNSQSTLTSSTNSRQSRNSDNSLNLSPGYREDGEEAEAEVEMETRLSKVIRSLQFVDKFGNGYDIDLRSQQREGERRDSC